MKVICGVYIKVLYRGDLEFIQGVYKGCIKGYLEVI